MPAPPPGHVIDPPPAYCGTLKVLVPCVQVAGPLLPMVVKVIGRFIRLEASPLAGTPRAGVTKVGLTPNTKLPVPVAPVLVTPSKVTCPATPSVLLNIDRKSTRLNSSHR